MTLVAGGVLALGFDADGGNRRCDQGLEQINIVVVVLALQHSRDALEPHAGIDRRLRQIDAVTGRALLVLHEHEIPDLDKAVAVGIRRTWRTALRTLGIIVRTVIEKDFRARTARTCVAHLPEIVGGRNPDDAVVAEAGDFFPKRVRLIVVVIDGDRQALFVETVFFGD